MKYLSLSICCLLLLLLVATMAEANPDRIQQPVRAATALAERLLQENAGDFAFETIPTDSGSDVFELQSRDGKIVIRGNNGVSMASGLNWYLKHFCNCHVSLNYKRITLPRPLPGVKQKIRVVSPFKYRNFFNFCTFSYTMAWWDWDRWEGLIDYLALNGVNTPLAITGQEAVWQAVYKELGLTDQQIAAFISGPAHLPWWLMSNIDGLGGPLPQGWIEKHKILQIKILERERSLGMTPILTGFNGHVPKAVTIHFPNAKLHQTSKWAGMPGTWFLDPLDPLFQRLGKAFIKKQTQMYGTDHLYDADCFNEVNPPTDDPAFLAKMGKAVYSAMSSADLKAVWVFQGWFLYWQKDFWKPTQARALFRDIPTHRLLGLDLYGEKHPVWDKTEAFYDNPWVWNVICNLGQNVNMSGHLETMQTNLQEAMHSPKRGKLSGIGLMMEGFGYNPVVQEFILEKSWQPEPVNLNDWISAYAVRRYGSQNPRLIQAWKLLLKGPYSRTIEKESQLCVIPAFAKGERLRASGGYDPATAVQACKLLLECGHQLRHLDTYRFDLVNVTREMLSNLGPGIIADLQQAYESKNRRAFDAAGKKLLSLLRDMDALLVTNEHFLLGRWLRDAKDWAQKPGEENYYEWNARTIVTMWEPAKKSLLRDYASKQWNGLMGDFYYRRWELFIDHLGQALEENRDLNRRDYFRALKKFEINWIRQTGTFPASPSGDPVEVASRLYKKYRKIF